MTALAHPVTLDASQQPVYSAQSYRSLVNSFIFSGISQIAPTSAIVTSGLTDETPLLSISGDIVSLRECIGFMSPFVGAGIYTFEVSAAEQIQLPVLSGTYKIMLLLSDPTQDSTQTEYKLAINAVEDSATVPTNGMIVGTVANGVITETCNSLLNGEMVYRDYSNVPTGFYPRDFKIYCRSRASAPFLVNVFHEYRYRTSSFQLLNMLEWTELGYGADYMVQTFGVPPQFIVKEGVVYVNGVVLKKSGNVGSASTLTGTIPTLVRPAHVVYQQGQGSGGILCNLQVDADGTLHTKGAPSGDTNYVTLDNCWWTVER